LKKERAISGRIDKLCRREEANALILHPVADLAEVLLEFDKNLDDLGMEVCPARIDDDVPALFMMEWAGILS
jgi:hypothetical protein